MSYYCKFEGMDCEFVLADNKCLMDKTCKCMNEWLIEHDKQIRADAIKTIDEELKEVRHCLELAKEQMLIDYVYVACEHLDNIEKLKEQR